MRITHAELLQQLGVDTKKLYEGKQGAEKKKQLENQTIEVDPSLLEKIREKLDNDDIDGAVDAVRVETVRQEIAGGEYEVDLDQLTHLLSETLFEGFRGS